MRIFNNKISDLPGGTAKLSPDKPAPSQTPHPSDALPPGMDARSSRASLNAFMRRSGARMGDKLTKAFNALQANKTPGSGASSVADLLRLSHQSSYAKFLKHEADVNKAMAEWANGNETLAYLLKPYISPGSKTSGMPDRDGLRAGVTTLLNGIYKEGSKAPQDLQDAARALSNTPIIRLLQEDGTSKDFMLTDFATPGQHGTGMLDGLDMPAEHRKQIAQRLALALADLRNIGDAYLNNAGSVPGRLLNDADYVLVSPHGPEAPRGADLKRRPAVRRPDRTSASPQRRDSDSSVGKRPRPAGPQPDGTGVSHGTPETKQRLGRPPPAGPRPISGTGTGGSQPGAGHRTGNTAPAFPAPADISQPRHSRLPN